MTDVHWLEFDDFARRFALRARNLMWLLGAGASASSNVPTAWDMIWEFKQRLYVSQRRVSPSSVSDLSNSAIRTQLQGHIDSIGGFPPPGDPDEYAALFEAVYPSEGDRRIYIDSKISGAKPSYGHIALATLMKEGLARIVWTTNFDPLIADACAKVYDATGNLTTVSLDAPDLARQAIQAERWPIEIKMHGDFRSRRLKNTTDELRAQDRQLRQILVDTSRRFGLVVSGYSGRDASVMDALEEAIGLPHAFSDGLFWLHRGEEAPFPRAMEIIRRASITGTDAHFVRIDSFDETMRDLLIQMPTIDKSVANAFAADRQRWSAAPMPVGSKGWPVVRLNALPVTESPSVCRRVVCRIGGYRQIREAVQAANADLIVARNRQGVLLFGDDQSARTTFGPFHITDFDLHPIEKRRLRYDSADRGLLREGLARAISREHRLDLVRRRSSDLLAPNDPRSTEWAPLKAVIGGPISGSLPKHPHVKWREGLKVRLDWADDRLWLLLEPRTVFDGLDDAGELAAADFARDRNVKRYNMKVNELLTFWANLLAADGRELRAFGTDGGVDAAFRLSAVTAFSRRAGA